MGGIAAEWEKRLKEWVVRGAVGTEWMAWVEDVMWYGDSDIGIGCWYSAILCYATLCYGYQDSRTNTHRILRPHTPYRYPSHPSRTLQR